MDGLIPLALLVVYLVPFLIAAARDHDSLVPILLTNFLLGWTVVGWIAVLVWACWKPRDAHEAGSADTS